MKTSVLVFSLLLSGSMMQAGAQSVKESLLKNTRQRQLVNKPGKLPGLVGKNGLNPDSIEHYYFDPFDQEYEEFANRTEVFSYDQNGNVLEHITHEPPYGSYKYNYVYANAKVIEETRHEWNPVTAAWFPTDRTQVFSDGFGEDTAEIYSLYDTSNSIWVESGRYITAFDYDNQDRPVMTTYKYYDAMAQQWDMDTRIQFIYMGADTLPSQAFVFEWDNGVWINYSWAKRLEWGLGFSPNLDDIEPTLVMGDTWDGGNWIPEFYDSSSVDNGKILDYFSYSYDMDSMYYICEYSQHYSFDFKDNQTSYLSLDWEFGSIDTNSMDSNFYIYGSSGEILEKVSRYFSFFNGNMNESKNKEVYYYGTTSLVAAQEFNETLYPNPLTSSQKLFVQSERTIKQIHLYAGNGALLRSWSTPEAEGMDMKGLAPGLYFIRLTDEEGNASTQRLQIR